MRAIHPGGMAGTPTLHVAFEAYASHRATLGQASVIARLPLTVFLEEARRHGVLPVYGIGSTCHAEA